MEMFKDGADRGGRSRSLCAFLDKQLAFLALDPVAAWL